LVSWYSLWAVGGDVRWLPVPEGGINTRGAVMDIKSPIKALVESLLGIYMFWTRSLPLGTKLFHDIKYRLPQFRAEIVFDIGANVGQSARKYLFWFSVAQIFCFEPVELTFNKLQENLKGYSNVRCFNLALGGSNSRGDMVLRGPSERFFLVRTPEELSQYSQEKLEKVEIQTLDDFCKYSNIEKISYLKIDTEGNDLEVLKGAQGLLNEQRIDIVEVEAGMNPENTRHVPFEVLTQYLEQRNYFLFGIYEQMHEWPTNAPHLRRTNPVFISKQVREANTANASDVRA
jgi:FkbM family methyltransferase